MSQTGEHPAVVVNENTEVRTDLKTILSVLGVFAFGVIGYADLKSGQREGEARQGTIETQQIATNVRVERLEEAKAASDLHFAHIDDKLEHISEGVDLINRKVSGKDH